MERGELGTIARQFLLKDAKAKEVPIIGVRGRLVIEGEKLAICVASAKSLALLCT
jgi:hypothetical protein